MARWLLLTGAMFTAAGRGAVDGAVARCRGASSCRKQQQHRHATEQHQNEHFGEDTRAAAPRTAAVQRATTARACPASSVSDDTPCPGSVSTSPPVATSRVCHPPSATAARLLMVAVQRVSMTLALAPSPTSGPGGREKGAPRTQGHPNVTISTTWATPRPQLHDPRQHSTAATHTARDARSWDKTMGHAGSALHDASGGRQTQPRTNAHSDHPPDLPRFGRQAALMAGVPGRRSTAAPGPAAPPFATFAVLLWEWVRAGAASAALAACPPPRRPRCHSPWPRRRARGSCQQRVQAMLSPAVRRARFP